MKPYYEKNGITIYHGDCLEVIPGLGAFDMVLADPPYGTTACKWDSIIPLDPMWKQLQRVIKGNAAIVMTASQPFTSQLIQSNIQHFKYCLIWEKDQCHSPLNAKYQPLKVHEEIAVFSQAASTYSPKVVMKYFPIMEAGVPYTRGVRKDGKHKFHSKSIDIPAKRNKGTRFPRSVLKFNRETGLHPTQKPVALMEYLIKTFTNEGETVLDFSMGSGTTLVSAMNTGRKAVGIELEESYCEIASKRIEKALYQTESEFATKAKE